MTILFCIHSAYADEITFILKNVSSVIEIVSMIDRFSNYLGLKSNISKCEIAGSTEKGSCGSWWLRICWLTSDAVKISGVHFSYNKEIQNKKTSANFFRHSKYSEYMEEAKSNDWRKNNNFQNIGTIKSCLSCTFDNCSQSNNRGTDKDQSKFNSNFIWKKTPAKSKHDT